MGITSLPSELSDWEFEELFLLSKSERSAIATVFRIKNRTAIGIQLGFMRLSGGRLGAFKVIPRNLLQLKESEA